MRACFTANEQKLNAATTASEQMLASAQRESFGLEHNGQAGGEPRLSFATRGEINVRRTNSR